MEKVNTSLLTLRDCSVLLTRFCPPGAYGSTRVGTWYDLEATFAQEALLCSVGFVGMDGCPSGQMEESAG